MKNYTRCFLAVAILLSAAVSQAATKTYVGPAGKGVGCQFFHNPAVWDPAGIPGEGDDVIISKKNGNSYGAIVAVTSDVKIASLTIGNGVALTLFASNTVANTASVNASIDTQKLVDPNDTSPASFEVTGNLTLNAGRILVGASNWKRNATIKIGGDLVCADNTSTKAISICAGPTNGTCRIEDGTAFFTVDGDAVLGSTTTVTPYCHTTQGGSVVFRFGNLEVKSGAKITADARGFDWSYSKGRSDSNSAGYGGRPYRSGVTYGTYDAPYLPGSAGGLQRTPRQGGGAIRIVATNVVMNGLISANGGTAITYIGSGGAVWIKCRALTGAGTITADATGGDGSSATSGGGGRIALDVESASTNGLELTVQAAPGILKRTGALVAGSTTVQSGEAGTVYARHFPTIVALLPRCMAGVFYAAEDVPASFTNTLSQTPKKAHWYFPQIDEIVFPNDFTFQVGAVLGVGALGTPYLAADGTADPYSRSIGRPQKAVFLGNVTMKTNSCIIVNSSRNALQSRLPGSSECVFKGDLVQDGQILAFGQGSGCAIRVAGDWTLSENGRVYPVCDKCDGTSVTFDVGGAFSMEAGSQICADGRGYGNTNSANNACCLAPGLPGRPERTGLAGGGTYGGSNGIARADSNYGPARVYGSPYLPFRPGSCGSYASKAQHPGGGVAQVRAASVSLAGAISANGLTGYNYGYGSSSGGGILITSRKRRFTVAPTASLTAVGGSANNTSHVVNQNGGGGRIALGIGVDDAVLEDWLGQLAALGDVYAEVEWSPGRKVVPYTAAQITERFPGATFSAAGGSNTSYSAQAGTVCIYEGPRQNGLTIFVQ